MPHYMKQGLFRKKTTKYKPLYCNHADWLIFRALAARSRRTIIEMLHETLTIATKCTAEDHERKIESLENQRFILAVELKKYQDRFGIIKTSPKTILKNSPQNCTKKVKALPTD